MSGARRRSTAWGLRIGLLVLLAACEPREREARSLRLLSFRQNGQAGVFLNEPLVLHFDAELDRSSVTHTSFTVRREDGVEAEGLLEVQGAKLFFRPEAPLLSDYSDAGLLPSSRYEVRVLGFPNPDGVRGRAGEPLSRTYRFWFETTGGPDEEGPHFEDSTPERASPLQFESNVVGPFDPIRLVCDEPLDPATLRSEDFDLRRAEARVDEVIALRARLAANDGDGAIIELRAVDEAGRLRALPLGKLWLWMFPDRVALRDFGGHPVLPSWLPNPQAGILTVTETAERLPVESHLVDFSGPPYQSPELADDTAGTARWSGGTVEVRFPAAAGTGEDGPVELSGEVARKEISATRLHVPRGAVARLTAPGLVVLRSQGRITIEGSLRRDVEGRLDEAEALGLEPYADWHRWIDSREAWDVPGMQFDEGESLSRWLTRAQESDQAWTVIVAGGELIVRGDVRSDGPLLLVAGGWIRVIGEVRDRPREFWTLDQPLSSRTTAMPRLAPLQMDAPKSNPLAVRTTWTAISSPFRPSGGVERWLSARVFGEAGAGEIAVSYIGERDLPGTVEVVGPVDSPVLLEDCEAVRVRIDLSMGPANGPDPRWVSPFVDAVELAWEQPELSR